MPEKQLQGIPASDGIAMGPAFPLRQQELEVEGKTDCDPAEEINRLESAVAQASEEIKLLKQQAQEQVSAEEAEIFEVHAMFLEDPALIGQAQQLIKDRKISAEAGWQETVAKHSDALASLEAEYMRERAADVRDVGRRVLRHLLGIEELDLEHLNIPSVIIADDLAPSDTIRLNKDMVLAFCTAAGGPTSHSAILARSLGIPAVVGIGPEILEVSNGVELAVNGQSGLILVEPSEQSSAEFQARAEALRSQGEQYQGAAMEPATTQDGHHVEVVANVGRPKDAEQALELGAEGIGLLRTEFLFLERSEAPTEQEQTEGYKQILDSMESRPVIARTLDIGGDKEVPYIEMEPEENPFLGVRAIRLGLEQPELLMMQLRSLLRASPGHNLHIMFPMIATLEELRQAREMLKRAREQVVAEGLEIAEKIPIGIMVEIPSVVLMADQFAQEVDFFSIGTNDLTQYTFAAERANPNVAYLTDACHPAVLRQVHQVIEAAHKAGIWVGMCGEMAGDPEAIAILLGLGLDEFSMGSPSIPRAKAIVRQWTLKQARELAERALSMSSASEVRQAVNAASQVIEAQ
jgi:phosphotransferase system enzyme I (PtsI)